MDVYFFLKLGLILLVFLICLFFRKENMKKGD